MYMYKDEVAKNKPLRCNISRNTIPPKPIGIPETVFTYSLVNKFAFISKVLRQQKYINLLRCITRLSKSTSLPQ